MAVPCSVLLLLCVVRCVRQDRRRRYKTDVIKQQLTELQRLHDAALRQLQDSNSRVYTHAVVTWRLT